MNNTNFLRKCQILALNQCKKNDNGIIRMCCGSGKTRIEIELCLQEQISCLVAPRNALLKQHVNEFKKILGYTDNEIDKDDSYSFSTETFELITINCESDFEKYQKSNKKTCFLINNSSIQKLPVIPDILIIDEAHTHKDSIKKTRKIKNIKRKYFFTATPQDMDDADFYGETIYRYDYDEAVIMNYVTEFKMVPIWSKENFETELQEKMKERNLSHCIHFYETVKGESSKNLKLNNISLKKFKNGQKITDKTKDRDSILNNFKQNGGHLLSCKTISYGIDIPQCDSVFLSYIGNSIPDLVQKIMRSIRLYSVNPNKIAYVFILMDLPEFEEGEIDLKESQQQLIFNISSMLKEGIDIDILNNYHPYNNKRVIEKLNNELVILEEILEESENIECVLSESNETESVLHESIEDESGDVCENLQDVNLENIKQAITETKNVINTLKENENKIKKSKFEEFYDDFELRTWYTNGEIIAKLSYNENQWQENYENVDTFVKVNNKLPSHGSKNKEENVLGIWCNTQRQNYKKEKLSKERIDQLQRIPEWKWDVLKEKWDINYENLNKFVKQNNRFPSERSEIKEEKVLGSWYRHRLNDYIESNLKGEQIKKLEEIEGWTWGKDLDEEWQEKFNNLVNFVGKNKKLPYEKSKNQTEAKIGKWCSSQHRNYKGTGKRILTEKQISQLEEINGWVWDNYEKWNTKLNELSIFVSINKKLPNNNSENKKEVKIARWCSNQRLTYKGKNKSKPLSDEQIKELSKIPGWYWENNSDEKWKETYKTLDNFVKKDNKIPSSKSKIEEEKSLGEWGNTQRQNYKKGNLSEERIKQLKEISGWYWTKEEKEITQETVQEEIIPQEPIQQETKMKKMTTIQEEKEKLKNLTYEELLDQIAKLKLQSKSNYQAINPIEKNEINELFSKNIKGSGIVIVLDDPEFNSAKTLIKYGIDKNRIIIPNNSGDNEIMINDKTFGKCVKQCSLQTLLNTFIDTQHLVSGIYADLMGSFTKEIPILEQIIQCNLDKDTVIGFTVSARENQGANFTNGFSNKLLNKMSQKFNDNLIENDEGVYVYGNGMTMATCVFKNIKK